VESLPRAEPERVPSGYTEWAPPADLADFVACTWLALGSDRSPARILPDGCVDVIWAPGRAPVVAGPDTFAKLETLPPGPHVGIRFRTGAAGALLAIPARAIRELRVPLEDVWPRDAARRLAEGLAAADTSRCRLRALEAAVRERARGLPPPDPAVRAAVAAIGRRIAARSVREPAAAVPVGARQLRRRFGDAVGYGPKPLERVLRLQRFLALARTEGGGSSLAALAAASGYADQAHLTRECRDLAGLTPAALRPQTTETFKTEPGAGARISA
jgi:methylphosphotriester-DNA--protein-cysteine methyltransferase